MLFLPFYLGLIRIYSIFDETKKSITCPGSHTVCVCVYGVVALETEAIVTMFIHIQIKYVMLFEFAIWDDIVMR